MTANDPPSTSPPQGEGMSRRDAIKHAGAAAALAAFASGPRSLAAQLRDARGVGGGTADFIVAGQPVTVVTTALSPATVRITVRPTVNGQPAPIPVTGALTPEAEGLTSPLPGKDFRVRLTDAPPTIHVELATGRVVQRLTLDAVNPGMSFLLPHGPLLGLGEGGPQFDRKGSTDRMVNGQGGFRLATNGTRAPVQWLVGTDGWAMFIHQPYGAFDFSGTEGRFTPSGSGLPLDLFVVRADDPIDPKRIMAEYARISGLPEMPALWTFGYQQSHRTLNGRAEILAEARMFRDKKLPCDAMIYLGTEFAPSGWNTRNGEFNWHPTNFPDPKVMLDALHADHFKAIVHVVIEGRTLTGSVSDPCTAASLPPGRTPDDRWPPDRQVSCYWPAHRPLIEAGVDGWWPDQGDGFDGPSRFNRHRMYWEGTQRDRPNERPFALHRNASAGIQRFGGFIWSGDVQSQWSTLATHVPVAVNTGLSGLPYWGTDIGGFNTTAEYTGELHVRWFQFGAFCPLFAPMDATGISSCRGDGTAATAGPPRAGIFGSHRPNSRTPPSSRFSVSISNYDISCYRISTRRCATPTRPGCRSCAPSGCTFLMTRSPLAGVTSTCGGRTSWSLRSSRKAPPPGPSISPEGRGSTTGRRPRSPAEPRSIDRWISPRCRSTSAPVR